MQDLYDRKSVHFDTRFKEGWEQDHIPGTQSMPFNECFNADHTYKTDEELLEVFKQRDFNVEDKQQEIVMSCMAGMTSCCVTHALWITGFEDVKLYNNSYQEYKVRKGDWPQ